MFRLIGAALAALVLGASAVVPGQAADEARVRVLHASPDAPSVDVYANGARVLSNVPFKAASDYLSVPAGDYTFEVRPAGAAAGSAPVLSVKAQLNANTDYTVAAVDRLAQIKSRIFVDNNAAPAVGKAHVQILHASPDAPNVDIALKGGSVLVPNLPFGEQKGPLPVDAGTYNLEIRAAGTNNVALPLDGVPLEAGRVYTFAAVGLVGGTPGLSVVPLSFTPSGAPIGVPQAGDGGLLGADDEDPARNTWLWLAVAGGIGIASLAGARLVIARVRN
jgi:hypothetical protein